MRSTIVPARRAAPKARDAARTARRAPVGALGPEIERARELGRLEERERIGREVHDTVLQGLAGISMLLRAADRALPEDGPEQAVVRERLRTAQDTLAMTLGQAHDLTAGVAVAELADGGLVPALTTYVALCRRHLEAARQLLGTDGSRGWLKVPAVPDIELAVTGTPRRLALPLESAVLWAVREGIANAVRHAAATHVLVRLDHRPNHLLASVRDDGTGLPTDATGFGCSGLGLTGAAQRLTALGGRLSVRTAPAGGTALTITVPGPARPRSPGPAPGRGRRQG